MHIILDFYAKEASLLKGQNMCLASRPPARRLRSAATWTPAARHWRTSNSPVEKPERNRLSSFEGSSSNSHRSSASRRKRVRPSGIVLKAEEGFSPALDLGSWSALARHEEGLPMTA